MTLLGGRTINSEAVSSLYDGFNTMQELSGSSITANFLSGGTDEIFIRADSVTSIAQLKDQLGSTIALVDSSGNTLATYTYDPYGGTSVSGQTNSNRFQFTGRENEGNGLYYHRARYYSPLFGRFISEDPLRLDGGDINVYAYVGNSPTNFLDPFGTGALPSGATVAGIAAGAGRAALRLVPQGLRLGATFGGEIATGASAATVAVGGLVVLDAGLAIYDGVQIYHLGEAYGCGELGSRLYESLARILFPILFQSRLGYRLERRNADLLV